MITHETKLMIKDDDEYKNQYQYNKDKREQLKKQAKVLVD